MKLAGFDPSIRESLTASISVKIAVQPEPTMTSFSTQVVGIQCSRCLGLDPSGPEVISFTIWVQASDDL